MDDTEVEVIGIGTQHHHGHIKQLHEHYSCEHVNEVVLHEHIKMIPQKNVLLQNHEYVIQPITEHIKNHYLNELICVAQLIDIQILRY